MLNQLEVRTAAGDLLTFVFDDVTDGYALEEIRGLDPVKATIVSSSWAGKDGKQYQSSRREERNIVISLGLEPDFVTTTVRSMATLSRTPPKLSSHTMERWTRVWCLF